MNTSENKLPQRRKAVILARVSTEEQFKEGKSIPAQLERAREHCQRIELPIQSEYQFDESSTKDQREKFEKVLEEIRNSKEKIALIVETIDRLQRSFKESVILDELRKQDKVEIHFLRENLVISINSNSADLLRWDMGVMFARSYVLQLSDNVKRSVEQKIKKGEWHGKAPIGYKNVTREDGTKWVEPNPERVPLIQFLFKEYASGNSSMNILRERAKELGVSHGVALSRGHIDKIFKNTFYYGVMPYKGKLYPHKYQPLIPKELFNEAQAVKASYNKKKFKFRGKNFTFSAGLISCAECGCLITFEEKKKKNGRVYIYGHCTNYFKKHKSKVIWIKEEFLIKQIVEVLKGMTIPEKVLQHIVKELKRSHKQKIEYHTKAMANLEAEYNRIETRIEKMYEDKLDGSITKDKYDSKVKDSRKQQEEILRQKQLHNQTDENYYIQAEKILQLASKAHELFMSSEVSEKRRLLKFLLQNSRLNAELWEITLQKPFNSILKHASCKQWLPELYQ